jgi:cell division transport system permease protein
MVEAILAPVLKVLPRRGGAAPIVPEKSVAGRTLLLMITIMSFLSAVTLGGVVLVQKSAIAWSADVGRELTIQIRPMEGETMETNIRLAQTLAQSTPGVASARPLTVEESQQLLEPWLGTGLDLTAIEIPRLIVVQLADPGAVDVDTLGRNVASIPGASLDTHAAWRQQLNTMAGTIVLSGLLILVLIGAATVLAIIFATRGAMSTNREIVDVLHYIGASNKFIAGEFQGRFLSIGLQGGLLGSVAALLFFALIGTAAGNMLSSEAGAQVGVLFGRFALGWDGMVGILSVVPVIAALTAITSRVTVRRYLAQTS